MTVANGGTLRGSGTVGGAVSVLSGGTLGGVGTINGATSITGVLSPGNGDGLIGTLNIANNVTWLGAPSGSSATDWVFNLGPSNASDKLNITGTFNRDTSLGSVFQFDFAGSANRGAFTLASWTLTGGNDFQSTDFTWKNLALGYDGTFQIVDTDLQIVVVPEPATWALLAASLTTVVIFRRRRK